MTDLALLLRFYAIMLVLDYLLFGVVVPLTQPPRRKQHRPRLMWTKRDYTIAEQARCTSIVNSLREEIVRDPSATKYGVAVGRHYPSPWEQRCVCGIAGGMEVLRLPDRSWYVRVSRDCSIFT